MRRGLILETEEGLYDGKRIEQKPCIVRAVEIERVEALGIEAGEAGCLLGPT